MTSKSYKIQDTPEGVKTLIYHSDKDIRIHSAYAPLKEAVRAVSNHKPGRASIIAVCGLGLGYHVQELRKRYPDISIIVFEHDPEVIDLASKWNPEVLKDCSIIPNEKDSISILDEMDISNFKGISRFDHRPSMQLHGNYYDSMISFIKNNITSRVSDLLTRFEFEQRWAHNIFNNIPLIFKSPSLRNFFEAFKGIPGIIVSAGPSLRRNIDQLASLRDKAVILAVDTSWKVLARKNIIPHFILTLDAQKYSLKHFLGKTHSDAVLIADVVSCPAVTREYNGRILMSTTAKYFTDTKGNLKREGTPVMSWIESFIDPPGDIQSGGSVATSAFDLLLNLGCDPIVLIGQDLAYTGREIHCSGTYHNDDWIPLTNRLYNLDTINQKIIRKRKIKKVKSFGDRGTVIADFVFDLYRSWFEDSASIAPVTVINATEGGARIQGTDEMKLSEYFNSRMEADPTPSHIIEHCFNESSIARPDTLITAIKTRLKSLKEMVSLLDSSDISLEKLEEYIKAHDLNDLFVPFLRKARLQISRRAPEETDQLELLGKNLKEGAHVLIKDMSQCLKNLVDL